jgi:acyl-CoA dehydrogenase
MKEASVILEEINRSGGNSAACHAQMYIMGALLRHGNEEQKRRYLPKIASGEVRLQAFGVTEPDAGSDTTHIRTFARKEGDFYVVNGGKIFTSRVQHSDMMLLLARTTPYEQSEKKTLGMSIFLVDLRTAGDALEVRPIDAMINHETNQLFFRDLKVPKENLIGEEGKGFYYILDGLNAERILVASESIGDARWFIARAVRYGKERVIFDRPIAQNQGIQFPIAQAYAQTEAADLMRFRAAEMFDAGEPCGPEANMAKLLCSQAAWAAANATLDTYGGYGFAAEYDVERKFRECRLFSIAPISNNMVLNYVAEHVLGMPRSY